jgi:hypothetical protein
MPNLQMPTSNRKPSFQYLVTSQKQIGWTHLLKGKFSQHWTQMQQLHIYSEPDINQIAQSSKCWLKQVLLHHLWTAPLASMAH